MRSTIAVFALLSLFLLPTTSRAQEGDLTYTVGWQAELGISYFGAAIWLRMWDDNWNLLDQDFNNGYEYASALVMADVHARNDSQSVHAGETIYWYWPEGYGWPPDLHEIGYIEDSASLPGAGPGSVTLSTDAFIPYNWVGDPLLLGLIYGGDDRGFSYYGGTSRISIVGDPYNPGINDGNWLLSPAAQAGLSEAYDLHTSLDNLPFLGGRLTQAARDDWDWGGDKKLAWAFGDIGDSGCDSYERLGDSIQAWTSSVRIRCHGYGANPVVPWPFSAFAPDIDWEFTLTLTFGFDQVQYVLDGSSDGYPSFELYLSGHPVLQQQDSGDPWDLVGWPDTPFYVAGQFSG